MILKNELDCNWDLIECRQCGYSKLLDTEPLKKLQELGNIRNVFDLMCTFIKLQYLKDPKHI